MKIVNTHSVFSLLFSAFLVIGAVHSTSAKSSLIMNCPPNKYISCTEDLYNLSRFGNATYTIGYITYSAGMPVVTYHLNSCQSGYIKRTWNVEDPYWNWHTCTQYIYVSSASNNQLQINWPPDFEVEGCTPNVKPNQLPAPYNSPTWSGDECRMIGKSYSDMVFTVNKGCKKIMRTWKLIDWCDNNGFGTQWTHNQIIKIINEERPQFECPKEITANAFNCKNVHVSVPPLQVGPTSCGGSAVISNNSPYSIDKGADISGVYPIGTTKVTYTIQYGCGSRLFCTVNVVVKNAAAPTPYCLHSLVTTLMPVDTDGDGKIDNGMVDVWAKDLDRGSKSSCNYNPLRFSFSTDPGDMVKTFTCDDLGTNGIMMFVTDSKGGQSACMVNVIIQNNASNIPDCKRKDDANPNDTTRTVYQGLIAGRYGEPLDKAEIKLKYDEPDLTISVRQDTVELIKKDSFYNASGYLIYFFKKEKQITIKSDTVREFVQFSTTSNQYGNFAFTDFEPKDKSCTLSAEYFDNPRSGVNGKDVEYLTKFLLGDVQFESPYQWLAADVDGNKIIDVQDLNMLISFVTGALAELPSQSWYFVDKNKVFANDATILLQDLTVVNRLISCKELSDTTWIVGIKTGDIIQDNGLRSDQAASESRSSVTSETDFQLYPNPSSGSLFIRASEKGTITIQDLKGNTVLNSYEFQEGISILKNEMVDLLPSGIYIYTIQSAVSTAKGKWIKL